MAVKERRSFGFVNYVYEMCVLKLEKMLGCSVDYPCNAESCRHTYMSVDEDSNLRTFSNIDERTRLHKSSSISERLSIAGQKLKLTGQSVLSACGSFPKRMSEQLRRRP